MILENDKKILDSKTDKELANIWHDLNNFKCSIDFIHYKEEIERLKILPIREYEKDNIISLLHSYIESKISHKFILRMGNQEMSDEEFEDFWKGNHENDLEAKERDDKRTLKKIANKYNIDNLIDWNLSSKEILELMENLYEEEVE